MSPGRMLAVVGALGLLFACKRPKPPPAPLSTVQRVEAAVAAAKDLSLPASTSTVAFRETDLVVVVSGGKVVLAGNAYPVTKLPASPAPGFAAEDKNDGPVVLPLLQGLKHHRKVAEEAEVARTRARPYFGAPVGSTTKGDPRAMGMMGMSMPMPSLARSLTLEDPIVLLADASLPYQTLYEAYATAAEARYGPMLVAVKGQGGLRGVPLAASAVGRMRMRHDVQILVREDGVVIEVDKKRLSSSCELPQSATSAPATGSATFEVAGAGRGKLDACLGQLHKAFDATDDPWMTLGAAAKIPLGEIVSIMDAMGRSAKEHDPVVVLREVLP